MDQYRYNEQLAYHMRSQGLNPADPNHRAHFQHLLQQASQQPRYAPNPTGLPVNTTQGVIRTEARGIFVSNLNFKANEAAINAYFNLAGRIVSVDLQRDHQTKKSKGNCTIHFDSATSAQKAITMFNGKTFMSMRLQVRADKEVTAIDAPSAGPAPPQPATRNAAPPLIVSSTPGQSRRTTTKQDSRR